MSNPYEPLWNRRTSPLAWEASRSIYQVFLNTVRRCGARPALRAREASTCYNVLYSYEEFACNVSDLAGALIDMGVQAGDRMAIVSRNCPQWVIADMATLAIGAVDVPLYPTLTPEQMAYIIADSGVRLIFVQDSALLQRILQVEDRFERVQDIVCFESSGLESSRRIPIHGWHALLERGKRLPHTDELRRRQQSAELHDIASVVYTSGTTGEPKGAILSHGNFLSNVAGILQILDLDETDIELSILPLCHVFERIAHYTLMSVGATIAYATGYNDLAANLQEIRPTIVPAVPRLFEKMRERLLKTVESRSPAAQTFFGWALRARSRQLRLQFEGKRVPLLLALRCLLAQRLVCHPIRERMGGRLRYFVCGGAPLPKAVGEFFQTLGFTLIEGYGLTETSPLLTANPPERPKFGTAGMAIPGVQLRIAKDSEILARGPNVMAGYLNNPTATELAMDADGWFHTGDVGRLDEDGYLVITGRKKDLIVLSTGKKVAPQPIEMALELSPYIEQAMVIGDEKPYTAALIVPDMVALRQVSGIAADGQSEDVHPACHALIRHVVDGVNRHLAGFERIKRFALLPRPFSEDEGELTPTLKCKRRVVLDHFKSMVERVYQSVSEED